VESYHKKEKSQALKFVVERLFRGTPIRAMREKFFSINNDFFWESFFWESFFLGELS
jgi:hypothetical protein